MSVPAMTGTSFPEIPKKRQPDFSKTGWKLSMAKRGSLSGRLSRLKKEGLAPPVELKQKKETVDKSPIEGWDQIHQFVWKREVFFPDPLPQSFNKSLLLSDDQDPQKLIFYDTETTGLSTGAGTIPFLIGWGRLKRDRFSVVQYFLSDYPGEKFMMERLASDFQEDCTFVSYNGKTYDSHLINTRFLMNGVPVKQRKELDLLYMCRRLWRNILEDCRLGTIEEQILNIVRGPDIPGAEIPDVWFDFLKDGKTEKLELVFSHNLQDIHTLAILLNSLERIIKLVPDNIQFNRRNLGKFLLNKNEKGVEILKKEFSNGDREAAIFLSLFYKREESWNLAEQLWISLNHHGHNLFATEELAKYYEHKLKDPQRALEVVNKYLKGPVQPAMEIKEKLLHRKERLIKKINSLS